MRCIKPNTSQSRGIFDENLVKFQLISSGSIAYQQLMRVGFPSHLSIAELFNSFKENLELKDHTKNQKDFCQLLLLSCGLKWNHFKLGNTQIFLRSGKLELLSVKIKEDIRTIKQRLDKHILLRKKFKASILAARFCVGLCAKSRRDRSKDFVNEIHPVEAVPRKKIRLNRTSQLEANSTENKGTILVSKTKKCNMIFTNS